MMSPYMTRLKRRFVLLTIAAAGVIACATPRETVLPTAGVPGEEIAMLTRQIAGASTKELPSLLFKRGKAYISAAQRLRVDRGRPSGVFSWPPDADKFATCYDLAQANFHEIIRDYPRSPEAAESQFMLGLVCDYPHLVTFDQALDEYRKTIESYPDTDAARKAAARKKIIEDIMGNKSVTPIIRR